MEVLVRKRSPLRASFTKLYNNLMTLFKDEEAKSTDIESKFASLERVHSSLKELDEEILELLLNSKTEGGKYDDEFETIEEYNEKFDDARIRVNSFTQNLISQQSFANLNLEKSKLKLPKIELIKFGGEVKDWLSFWSQFSRIHEDKQLELEDKFQYLIQCMSPGTRAKEIIDSYPPTAENYMKAVESLKARFGREEFLIEFYVRELLGLVVKNATSTKLKGNITMLYDKLESHLRSLESIGMTSDKYAAMLFPLVESCIPEDILRVWLRNPTLSEADKSYSNKLSQLLLFLRMEVEGEERITLARTGIKQNDVYLRKQKSKEVEDFIPTANDLFSSAKQSSKTLCIFCGKSHLSKDCYQGQKLAYEEKIDILKNKKCCFSCLKIGHRSNNCRNNVRCILCEKRHFIIMCPEFRPKMKFPPQQKEEKESSTLSSISQSGEILLQTLMVAIEFKGKRRVARALIDTGSQYSYILKSTVEELGMVSDLSNSLTHIVFGGAVSHKRHKCYTINVCNLNTGYMCKIPVLDQPVICGSIPRIQKGLWLDELREKGIEITDVGYENPPIDLLIGADYAGKIYTGRIQQLKSNIVAMETCLGWVLMGKILRETVESSMSVTATSLLIHCDSITNLWELEAIGIHDPYEQHSKREIENAVQDHFNKTVKINEEGRYEIKLPWKREKDLLPDNKALAQKRLERTTSKLIADGKYEVYNSVFAEWLQDNVIEIVPHEELSKPSCYLPHRGVFKDQSTTKVRPVFDASSKRKSFSSLNECLETGPNILELIPTLLTRFRKNQIGVIADIKRAFLQISVNEEDRDYLRFLWWKDLEKKELQIFRHRRVVFGVTCSPFILGAVIQHHLENAKPEAGNIVQKLRTSFYVDNCVTSLKTEDEKEKFISISSQIMAKAKMELRGWECTTTKRMGIKLEPSHVLGLLWDREEDTLFCDIGAIAKPEEPLTRRNLLSIAQKIFDPIGFSCPVTLFPKLLLQESWKAKLSWDAELPNDLTKKFLNWFNELHLLTHIKIPRYLSFNDCSPTSLHIFCDASGLSYAAVVYLRSENEHRISVQLVLAKSRIAPLKKMSIPRMELMACTLGSRLTHFVKKALNLQNVTEYFWTDSSTALHWIRHDESWTVFVSNRVKEIRQLSKAEDWRHVPGSENPADLPSRGCAVKKLIESRWWEGPSWLKKNREAWPKSERLYTEEALLERKKTAVILVDEISKRAWFLSYFSSYRKIVRMVGWMLRFIFNSQKLKQDRLKGELSVEELHESEKRIIKIVQNESLSEEYMKGLKSLNIFKDEDGIFRIRTKLTERSDTDYFRYPIILPGKHKLVEFLIAEDHLKMMHAGVQVLLSNLREKFWIINGRRTVRAIINGCMRCKRHSAKCIETAPIGLPQDRIKEASVFEVVGVDLAGPLILKGGEKSWIVLYTCAVYRAVHLELVMSLSTKAFLLSLRRFIARRGRPKVIYSDNGKNFLGAENLFRSLDWNTINLEASISRIDWKFNPPSAAWWGGFWERLIQMIKKLLRRVLGNASLYYEEMISILCDCEAVVNSRPLTYLSEDPDDLMPLTPALFLQDTQTVGVPDLDQLDKINMKKRWKYQQTLREHLRKRFRLEYLGKLIQNREKTNYCELQVGDIVLIENESNKKILWPLAKVIEVYPGKDGNIRVARLKTATGELVRPVQRLYPLEIQSVPGKTTQNRATDVSVQRTPLNNLKETVTTRSGRTVRLPSRFRDI